MEGKKIGVISLGCDKNRVDTENILAFLEKDGYEFTGAPVDDACSPRPALSYSRHR